MAQPTVLQGGLFWTLPAAAAITANYVGVDLDADGKVQVAADANDDGVGVVLNKPEAEDQPAEIGSFGVYPITAGDAINENAILTLEDAVGYVDPVDAAGEWIIGVAVGAAAASGDIIAAFIGPFGDAYAA